jgi:hypothetical protein
MMFNVSETTSAVARHAVPRRYYTCIAGAGISIAFYEKSDPQQGGATTRNAATTRKTACVFTLLPAIWYSS